MDDQTTRIRALNDAARTSLIGCRVMITQGIQAQDNVAAVLDRVRAFDAYSEDNDPYGEHDFGSFRHGGETIFWKFDYYDQTLTAGSEDPSDPAVTIRVLTIMLASEY